MRFHVSLLLLFSTTILLVSATFAPQETDELSKEEYLRLLAKGAVDKETAGIEIDEMAPVTVPTVEEKTDQASTAQRDSFEEFIEARLSPEARKARRELKSIGPDENGTRKTYNDFFYNLSPALQKELEVYGPDYEADCGEGYAANQRAKALNRSWTPLSESDKEKIKPNLSAEARKALDQLNAIGTKSFDDIDKQVAFFGNLSQELQRELKKFDPLYLGDIGASETYQGTYTFSANLDDLKAHLEKNETAKIFVEKGLRDGKGLAELMYSLSKKSEEEKVDIVDIGKPEIEIDEIAPVTVSEEGEKDEKAAVAIEKRLRAGRGLIQVKEIGKINVIVYKNAAKKE